MRVLVDTNVLLRSAQPDHPSFFQGSESIVRLLQQRHHLFFCQQNIVEFWSVATRPLARNGLGLSQEAVLKEIASIEGNLTLLPDTPAIYGAWKNIVAKHRVVGAKVHDARLVAVMMVYGIASILTFNSVDFQRYSAINALLPASVLA